MASNGDYSSNQEFVTIPHLRPDWPWLSLWTLGHKTPLKFMTPRRQAPPKRKTIYYIGMAVGVIGFLSFISVFISGALHFGEFSDGRSEVRRAVFGMVLMIAGGVLTLIGRMGIAGSGIKLDPEEARRDVEPWARMTGGVVKDAIDEAGIKLGDHSSADELPFDERLRRLQKLREDGLVSEQEYETTKKKILESA